MVEVLTEYSPVEGLSQDQHVVAKLYDPMYLDDEDFYTNPFLVADKDHTSETAVYMALSNFQGSKIPRYYGPYSLGISFRSVRLTLIEFIPGLSMQKADPHGYSQESRQNIIKSVIDFDASAFARDIIPSNLHPRNIMLTDSGETVSIDLGGCTVRSTRLLL